MNAISAHINGFQHIGLPTNDLEKTIAFYETLGFEVVRREEIPSDRVAFLKLGNMVIETYESKSGPCARGFDGAIDHVALDVDDVEAAFEAVKAAGLTPMTDEIQFLPFWENGFKFFKVLDPNNAPVEFGQIL